jgi:hypothetical protein
MRFSTLTLCSPIFVNATPSPGTISIPALCGMPQPLMG